MEYALYKGQDLLIIGTIKEIAKARGVKEGTIRYYRTPTYRKRGKTDNRLILVKLEDD